MTKKEKIEAKKERSRKKLLEATTKEEEVEAQLELIDEDLELADLKKEEEKKAQEEKQRYQKEIQQMNIARRKERFAEAGGWFKSLAEIVAFPVVALGKIFGDNEFVAAFLDKSKIKEKADYNKEVAQNTEKLVIAMQKIGEKLENINKNLEKEKSK